MGDQNGNGRQGNDVQCGAQLRRDALDRSQNRNVGFHYAENVSQLVFSTTQFPVWRIARGLATGLKPCYTIEFGATGIWRSSARLSVTGHRASCPTTSTTTVANARKAQCPPMLISPLHCVIFANAGCHSRRRSGQAHVLGPAQGTPRYSRPAAARACAGHRAHVGRRPYLYRLWPRRRTSA